MGKGERERRTIMALTRVSPPSSKEPAVWDWASVDEATPRETASKDSWREFMVGRGTE